MFDHIGISVTDFSRSREFYRAALAPLGVQLFAQGERWAVVGKPGGYFWFGEAGPVQAATHFAFSADDHAQVQAFHAVALAAGGKDNGTPGPRPQYGEGYYAAFILDPDGYNIEAVCHGAA